MTVQWASVVDRATEIAGAYDTSVTLRMLFYRLASEGSIPLTASAYRRLSSKLAAARRAGAGPVTMVDLTRTVHVPLAWENAGAALSAVPSSFRLDRTRGQAEAVYVGAEKDTLRALFTEWTEQLGVPVLIVRGFASESYAQRVREWTASDGRPAVLLYVGDFDCSGEDVERDWVARTGCWARVERVALTRAQTTAYGLPATVGKRGDPRWPRFAQRHGLDVNEPVQWEVEALDPAELRRLILEAVTARLDVAALERVLADEREQRGELEAFVRTWPPQATQP